MVTVAGDDVCVHPVDADAEGAIVLWLLSVLVLFKRVLLLFGGEDPVAGDPWHHEDLSRKAATKAGWDDDAAESLAWHTDYVDSYLYNPAWWAMGGLDRAGVAMAIHDDLVKLHFDDLTRTEQVEAAWDRYLHGTVAGLLWAAEEGDIAAARNIVGAGLHAMQDFYSHSNWVDAAPRRSLTWFDAGRTTDDLGAPDDDGLLDVPVLDLERDGPDLSNLPVPGVGLPGNLGIDPPDANTPLVDLAGSVGRTRPIELPIDLPDLDVEIVPDAQVGAARSRLSLYTGTYELDDRQGIKPHGKFAFDCTAIRAMGAGPVLDAVCAPLSPFFEGGICDRWRDCKDGAAETGPEEVLGVPVPDDVLLVHPKGIALDNTWLADVAVEVRDVDDDGLTGRQLFDTAYDLALRTSQQWLQTLEQVMDRAGHDRFWHRVKTSRRRQDADEAAFEDPRRFPFQFLSAGEYPPTGEDDGYYLRVELATSSDSAAGTDADIVLEADGQEFLLDYMPYENPIVSWNDFEQGDVAVYTVGPFGRIPASITLRNDAEDAVGVIEAAGRSLARAFASIVDTVGDVLLSLIGGHADLVGEARKVWRWDELVAIARDGGSRDITMAVRGREEGSYDLRGIISVQLRDESAQVSIRWDELYCREESEWDRGTSDDEPFVVYAVHNFGKDETSSGVIGPFSGVDDGETRRFTNITILDVPRYGMVGVPIAIFESDDESASARRELADELAGTVEEETREERRGFLDALGAAIAPDWRYDRVRVYAFRRARTVEAGQVLHLRRRAWLEAGERRTFHLDPSRVRRVRLPAL